MRFFAAIRRILLILLALILLTGTVTASAGDFIKWVDFNAPYEAIKKAVALDIESHGSDTPLDFIELLAYIATKNGNNFKKFKASQLSDLASKLRSGKTMAELTEGMKHYPYNLEAYTAIFAGFVGEYEAEVPDGEGTRWERRYGVRVFSPIAKTFPYSHYDDFGTKRTYGFSRPHLGNDLMGQVGTPIVAVEGGVIEALGWNRYGGWRIGIRSHDTKRYYYYAHLRKGFPYHKDLQLGDTVMAGDVIGYLGRTGYSRREDVNNIEKAHLHFGLQLVFDESQKECDNEIWIDVYDIIRFLDRYRSEVKKNPETKDYHRVYKIREVTGER